MTTLKRTPILLLILAVAACSSPAAAPSDDAGGAEPTDESAASASAQPTDGGDGGGDGDASGYDLCEAISEEEVSEIAGVQVTDSTSAEISGVLSCNYNAADTAVAGTTLATSASGVDPVQLFDANVGAEGTEEISGIGDGAVMTGDENFPILMVKVNGNLYSLSVLADNLDGPGKRDATIELARLSVDRLP